MKSCLVSEGVPEDKIDIVAVGENENLSRSDVLTLHEANPDKPAFAKRSSQVLVWAYHRRVDLTLFPAGQKSKQFFPGNADEANLLFRSEWQGRRAVEKAGESTAPRPQRANQAAPHSSIIKPELRRFERPTDS